MINLLKQLEEILSENNSTDLLLQKSDKILAEILSSPHLELFFYDEINNNLKTFKGFESSLLIKDSPDYKVFLKIKRNHFVLNNEMYEFSEKETNLKQTPQKNILYIPLTENGLVFGLMKITTNSAITTKILNTLIIAASMFSARLISCSLSEKMEMNINFYQSMKSIAKVIENQYEPDYIMPIIGEILDKFVPEHLIYIFKKEEHNLHLIWPKAYTNKRLEKLKSYMENCQKVTLINEDMTGIFPLIVDKQIIGYIIADSNYFKISNTLKNYLEQLSYQTSVTMDKADVYSEILKNATIDSLTGLYNRGQLDKRIKQEIATSKRTNSTLCCLMTDIDFFKKINDTHGHAVGDFALKEIADIVTKQIRENDIAARYGGEEFVILLPFTHIDEAKKVGERIRKKIENKKFKTGSLELHITVSMGLSIFEPDKDNLNFQEEADKALYEAKNNGRNQLVIFENKT